MRQTLYYVGLGGLAVGFAAAQAADTALYGQAPSIPALIVAGLLGGWAIGNLIALGFAARRERIANANEAK